MSEENIKNDSVETVETETPEVEVNHVNSMIDKIGQALDDKRMTVANDWLNAGDTLQATQDAAGLDKVGVEPVEIDQDQEGQDEQPVVSEV